MNDLPPARRSALYSGTISHGRSQPAHGFRNDMVMVLVDLDELPALDATLRLFGHNRRAVASLWDRDHFGSTQLPLSESLHAFLDKQQYHGPRDQVLLLTQCRVLGYVFNPVSFFYLLDSRGALSAVVAEVHNTYGEFHPYLLIADNTAGFSGTEKKVFHVSPFMSLDGTYHFSLNLPGPSLDASIDVWRSGTPVFQTRLGLQRIPLTDSALARSLLRHPVMPQRVMASIYLEALQLWRKGARFYPKPVYDPVHARGETTA